MAAAVVPGLDSGFYGGVVLRQGAQEGPGVQFGKLSSAWGKFVAPTADESGARTLFFGGYRWHNDVALEASFGTAENYALSPTGSRGVGLSLTPPADAIATSRSFNADVYTSWSFLRRFSLYGRLGYAQSDTAAGPLLSPVDVRRRDGVNYGLGLRYDINRALGLRVEYARFNHFANELQGGVLPESDQVQLGVQLRF